MSLELTATNNKATSDDEEEVGNDDIDIRNEESKGLLVEDSEEVRDENNDGNHWMKMNYFKGMLLLAGIVFAIVWLFTRGTTRSVSMEDVPVPSIPIKQVQVANYIKGTALLLNIHITHHAGTSLCAMMRKFGAVPGFACMGPGKKEGTNQDWPNNTIKKSHVWSYNDTSIYVERFRPFFHFMSWEFSKFGNLGNTNWEYDNLVSTIIMRDPMERFLAGGKCGEFHKKITGDPTNETQALYWEYANGQCSDNYALRVLADDAHCVNGSNTTLACLESAKNLLRRFTFILDQTCLSESMAALGKELHLNITEVAFENPRQHKKHPSVRVRLNNDTLYEFLRLRFRRDIELYEWSKTQSIVQCV